MIELDEPEPPTDPPKSTPQPTAADSAKSATVDVPEGIDTARAFISYASADSSIAEAMTSNECAMRGQKFDREASKLWS